LTVSDRNGGEVPAADVSVCSNKRIRKLGLLDHLVGAGKQRGRDGEAEGLGCLHVDYEIDFVTCITGGFSGFSPFSTRPRQSPACRKGSGKFVPKLTNPPAATNCPFGYAAGILCRAARPTSASRLLIINVSPERNKACEVLAILSKASLKSSARRLASRAEYPPRLPESSKSHQARVYFVDCRESQ